MALPIILSLPHGGLEVPSELATRLAINATTVYNECDLWVDQLFDLAHLSLHDLVPLHWGIGTLAQVSFPTARVLIDANRPQDSLSNHDGAVKTQTSYGQAIYRQPLTPDEQDDLLHRYWQPFHTALEQSIRDVATSVQLFLDCHNMAQTAPSAYPHAGKARPLICLANFGDSRGEQRPGGPEITCAPRLIRRAAELASALFSDMELLEPAGEKPPVVAINHPFPGGYILRHYHKRLRDLTDRHVPCIMIEVNRGLFVGNQSAESPIAPMRQAEISNIRQRLYLWTLSVLNEISETADR